MTNHTAEPPHKVIDLYMYVSERRRLPTTNASLGSFMENLGRLYQAGFLFPGAKVWFNSENPSLGMWVLAEHSSHVEVLDTSNPQWVRITNTEMRISRTFRAGYNDGEHYRYTTSHETYRQLGLTEEHLRAVVVNHSGDEPLAYCTRTGIAHPRGGQFQHGPFLAVDILHYKAGTRRAVTNPYQAAIATIAGARLLSFGLAPREADWVKNNMDTYRLELDTKDFELLTRGTDGITKWATLLSRSVQSRSTKARHTHPMGPDLTPKVPDGPRGRELVEERVRNHDTTRRGGPRHGRASHEGRGGRG